MKHPAAEWRLLPVILAAVFSAVACVPGACAEDGAAFVARVGEEPISRARFDAEARRTKVSALPAGPQRVQAEAAILERLVDELLLEQAVAQDGVQVDSAAVDTALERLRGQIVGSGAAFTDFLAQNGLDEAGLRGRIGRELAVREFVERRVSTRAVETYWEKNRRELDGTLVRVSHVVLRPDLGRGEAALADCLARAAAIRGSVLQGEKTFAEAARAHSAGPSRRRDGDVGFMPRRSAAHEEFAKQAFALAKGDISQPFVTPFGVHILQVTDVQPGDRTLVSLRPQIEQAMAQQIVREAVADARRGTPVEYAPGVAHFDPATPVDGAQPRRVVVAGPSGTP
jgi:peptidyl-prolyl cis-trans isomerase SurA